MRTWNPFSDSFRILERFGDRFRPGWLPDDALEEEAALTPAADVFEDREGLHIEVELPGVAPRDVQVTVSGDAVTVEAERVLVRTNGRSIAHLEGRYGRMRRTFPLPVRAEPSGAIAEMHHGVLRVFVPRAPSSATVLRTLRPADVADATAVDIH